MARRWFYAHNGNTHGPVPARRLKYLAATGWLQPEDVLWLEGSDPARAVVAGQVMDFAGLRLAAQRVRQRAGASDTPATGDELPGWLDEIDGLFRDPEQALGPVPDWLKPDEPPSPALPDWLSDPTGDTPPAPEPEPAEPVAPIAVEVPLALPVAAPVGNTLLERMGIDPHSERVVDWAKLKAWLQEQIARRPGGELPAPSELDADPFQTARKQLAAWFDLKKNRDRLAQGEEEAIRQDPALQQFLSHFLRYGSDKQKHLGEFVDFLIETRRRDA